MTRPAMRRLTTGAYVPDPTGPTDAHQQDRAPSGASGRACPPSTRDGPAPARRRTAATGSISRPECSGRLSTLEPVEQRDDAASNPVVVAASTGHPVRAVDWPRLRVGVSGYTRCFRRHGDLLLARCAVRQRATTGQGMMPRTSGGATVIGRPSGQRHRADTSCRPTALTPATMSLMTDVDAETAMTVGGWDPRYARVVDVQVNGDVAAALVDANGDGADLTIDLESGRPTAGGTRSRVAAGTRELPVGAPRPRTSSTLCSPGPESRSPAANSRVREGARRTSRRPGRRRSAACPAPHASAWWPVGRLSREACSRSRPIERHTTTSTVR